MRFSAIYAAALILAGSAVASNPSKEFVAFHLPTTSLQAGKTYDIQWTSTKYLNQPMTFELLRGETADTLQYYGQNLTTHLTNVPSGNFSWAVWTSLGDDPAYGIRAVLESNPNIYQYSDLLTIEKQS